MPAPPVALDRLCRGAAAVTLSGAGALAYASLYEVNAYRLRRFTVPVLPPGSRPIRVLHLSDLHMTPRNIRRQQWVSRLAALEPDLVVDTGDNLAHPGAVPYVVNSLDRLLERPGVYVWGSNDYYAPGFKNPLGYLVSHSQQVEETPDELPWRELDTRLCEAGWVNLTHRNHIIEVNGVRVGFRGTDDAHLARDRYEQVAGPVDRNAVDVAIAVTHAPYLRLLDPMTADGHDLIMAGHTHGGQVCVPGYGALVTNCDLNVSRAKGLSSHTAGDRTSALHVSAGLGTSPYAPIRFACPPEATLLTLTSA